MPHAFQIHKQEAAYFLTPTVVEWVNLFQETEYKNIICESLNYCIDNKGLEIFAYVIMSTHLHLIASAKDENLSSIIRDFKKFTLSKIKYIHNNPVDAGLVDWPEQYHFSSAKDYAGFQGPVKISALTLHNLY